MPTDEQILKALEVVIDPELRKSIVELGMVRSIEQADDGKVAVIVSLTTAGCPIRNHFETAVAEAVGALEGVTGVSVSFDVLSDTEKGELQRKLGRGSLPEGALAQVSNVVCIGSGKARASESSTPTFGATQFHACSALPAARRFRPSARSFHLRLAA